MPILQPSKKMTEGPSIVNITIWWKMYKNNFLCKNTNLNGSDRRALIYLMSFLKVSARYLHESKNLLVSLALHSHRAQHVSLSALVARGHNVAFRARSYVLFIIVTFSSEKVLYLCKMWRPPPPRFCQMSTFWDPLNPKKWFSRMCLSVCLCVCLSVCLFFFFFSLLAR